MGNNRSFAAAALASLVTLLAVPTTSASAAANPRPPAPTSSLPPAAEAAGLTPGSRTRTPWIPTSNAPSSANWTWQNPLPNGNSFFAISCPTASTCFAAGEGGPILRTVNEGASWTQLVTAGGIFGLSCASATTCMGVGNGGLVIGTTNGGSTWGFQIVGSVAFLAAVSCPTTTMCVAVGSKGSIFVTTDGGVTWAARSYGFTAYLFGISCPSALVCYAVGDFGVIIATTNGGATWTVQYKTQPLLAAISCPSTTSCAAVGLQGTIVSTTNSGGTWTNIGSETRAGLFGISCPSTTECFAAGDDGEVHVGFSWIYGNTTVGANGALWAISCPTTTQCLTAGDYGTIAVTTNAGTGWSTQATGLLSAVQGMSCPTTTTCFGAHNSFVERTTNAGTTWSELVTGGTYFNSISCPNVSVCFAAGGTATGGAISKTIDAGTTWSQTFAAPSPLNSISCATTTNCVAVVNPGTITRTSDGVNWTSPSFGPCVGSCPYLTQVSCPSASVCFLAAGTAPGQVWSSGDGGATWAISFDAATNPYAAGGNGLSAINCPSTTVCYAAGPGSPSPGPAGVFATTTNGGVTWRTLNGPASTIVSGISCPTTGTCYVSATGASIFHTADFGGTWDVQLGGTNSWYWSISCPSTTVCFAGGSAGSAGGIISATTTAGAAWSVLQPAGSTNPILGISCGTSSDCYAAALNQILASHDAGSTWSTRTLTNGDQLSGMSCPSASTCFASGWPGATYITGDSGATWTIQPSGLYGSDETMTNISCWSTTGCVAVGTHGRALSTTNGTTWTLEATGTLQSLLGVSCPTSNFCVAVGRNGTTLTRLSGVWSTHQSGTTLTLHDVRCPTARTCYAAGNAGTVIVTANQGATWSALSTGAKQNLYGISCVRTTRCLAVGNGGAVLLTLDGMTWASRPAPTSNLLFRAAFTDVGHVLVAGFGGTILADAAVPQPCDSTSLSPGVASPQAVGTTVTFTAISSGCTSPEYKFFLQAPGGAWTAQTSYGGPTWILNTSGLAAGVYGVGVWARQVGSSASYDSYFLATYTLTIDRCTAVTLTPSTTPPQVAGTSVTFTAAAAGCPGGQFRLWVLPPGGSWTMQRDYGTSMWAWNTTGLAAGTYQIGAWARQSGSTASYDAYGITTFALGTGNCISAGMTPSLNPPQAPGASVLFTANSNACSSPQYQFWLLPPGGSWTIMQPFAGGSTWTWSTAGYAQGTYQYGVWVKQTGSAATYDAYFIGTFQLAMPSAACTSATISSSPPSPQNAGAVIQFAATSTGCISPRYEFWEQAPGGAWTILQPYSSTTTFTWDSTTAGRGLYRFGVWVLQAGFAGSYDSYSLTSFVNSG